MSDRTAYAVAGRVIASKVDGVTVARIVSEALVGRLKADPRSYVSATPLCQAKRVICVGRDAEAFEAADLAAFGDGRTSPCMVRTSLHKSQFSRQHTLLL